MRTLTHSERAMQAAIEAFGMDNDRAAAVYIFIAAARHLGRIVESETAAGLAYMMADELATGGEP
jgi:hypothetical protein